MIIGTHCIIYSRDPQLDRSFLRDTLKLTCVDAGGGWLIFALPPSELGIHPAERNDVHELYLICEDIQAFVREMRKQAIECTDIEKREWGMLTRITLPGGGKLGVYQATHGRPA